MQTRILVGFVDDGPQSFRIHLGVTEVGCQRNGGLVNRRALDHGIAAGQVFGNAAQMNAREHHLRTGRADVNAYAVQNHIVLPPQRLLRRIIPCEIMVMIMVGITVMGMAVILTILVILHGVQGLGGWVLH